jgi:hypothetical protein
LAKCVIPVGLKGVGDETIVGVDAQIAPTGDIGMVAGSLDMTAAEALGFVGPVLNL